jgi:hypothetical protein
MRTAPLDEILDDLLCGWCRGQNDLFDDLGAFYCTPVEKDERPTCLECFRGEVGQRHQARYGVGDR